MKKLLAICLATLFIGTSNAETTLTISSILLEPINCDLSNTATVTLTPIGGQPPYTFQIDDNDPQDSNVFEGIQEPGDHVFTVRDSSHQSTQRTVNVGPTVLAFALTSEIPPCSGESNGVLGITLSGGELPLTVTLKDAEGTIIDEQIGGSGRFGFTGLAAGTYTIEARATNTTESCPATTIVFDLANPAPLRITKIRTTSQTPSTGGTITIESTGGIAPEYALNDGELQESNVFTDLEADTYEVTVVDQSNSNCKDSAQATVDFQINSIFEFSQNKYCTTSSS